MRHVRLPGHTDTCDLLIQPGSSTLPVAAGTQQEHREQIQPRQKPDRLFSVFRIVAGNQATVTGTVSVRYVTILKFFFSYKSLYAFTGLQSCVARPTLV